MKKVKPTQEHKKTSMNPSKKILLFAVAGIIILATIVLIWLENQSGRIKVTNNTDLKLEYVRAYFVDAEGKLGTPFEFENLEAGDKRTMPLEMINLLGREANIEIRFKFENYDKLFVDAGYFNDKFDGRINVTFEDTEEEGKAILKVKAANGFLPYNLVVCDEEYDVDYINGSIPD